MSKYKLYRSDYETAMNIRFNAWICEDANGDIFIGRSAQEAFDHYKSYYGL